jgi:hypothetical protein
LVDKVSAAGYPVSSSEHPVALLTLMSRPGPAPMAALVVGPFDAPIVDQLHDVAVRRDIRVVQCNSAMTVRVKLDRALGVSANSGDSNHLRARGNPS